MSRFILYILLLAPFSAAAQWTLTAQVSDEAGTPVASASIELLSPEDSSLFRATTSDGAGRFSLQNIPSGSWLVKVSFLGLRTVELPVEQVSGTAADLGRIILYPDSLLLHELTVEGARIPVAIKKDTIEYDARSFKTKDNAVVEELLQKMPGIRVETDGTIIAQGEQVKRVTVDGKEFFGKDPKLATRNLPAGAIDKVQVIDRKSEQSRFSGIDDGKQQKAINLVLKDDRKKGAFGSLMAGAGNSERWQSKASVNRFSQNNQLSFLGMANNTNQQGFSMDEYLLYSGAARKMAGGGPVRVQVNSGNTNGVPLDTGNGLDGLIKNYAGGLNFQRQAGKNTSVNGSYFFHQLDHTSEQTTTRENFQPDPADNFISGETASRESLNIGHRGNLTIDHAIDSAHSLRFNGSFTRNTIRTAAESISNIQNADKETLSDSKQYSAADIHASSWVANLLYGHKFAKEGRRFSAAMDMVLKANDSNGTLTADNLFYSTDTIEDLIDQRFLQSGINRELGAVFSYTEPLGKRSYLEAKYAISQTGQEADRKVYNSIANHKKDSFMIDESLSNIYNSKYLVQRGGINFQRNGDQYNLTTGLALQYSRLSGIPQTPQIDIRSSFSHLLPSFRLNYAFAPHKRLRVDYETTVEAPTIEQLQPVTDNSDPLHIYTGNPNLDPEYRHNLRASYHHFDPEKFIGFLGLLDVTYTENAITSSQRIDEQFIRYSKPVNLEGALSIKADASLTFPLTKINSNLTFGARITDNHSAQLLNGVENNSRQSALGFNLRYNYSFKEVVDLNLGALVNRVLTGYEIDQPSQVFLHQAYSAETFLNFLKDYQFACELQYLLYKSSGFTRQLPLLDLSVSRTLLENNALEVKLSAVNLLDTDTGVTQQAGANYLERQLTSSLGRYYMVSLTYTLNKQLNPAKAERGEGMKIFRKK